MDATNRGALILARRLRELREREWPDRPLTQAQLAVALSAQGNVAPTTLASWESHSNPKTPPVARLISYARFFATRRSLIGEQPHLIAESELDEEERDRFGQLRTELLSLHLALETDGPDDGSRRRLLSFPDTQPVVILCPEAPEKSRGPLADEADVNFTRLHRYADLDALIEMFGHVRAENPRLNVLYRVPDEIQHAELQYHLILLGGIGWNTTVRRILAAIKKLPIEQIEDARLRGGEVFRVKAEGEREEQTYFPTSEEVNGTVEQVEDLALIARLSNPFNSGRTVTICNGVHSRGVVGAVLTMTDETARPANEEYLARRFPAGNFAMLVRVPVVNGRVLAPDLQNPENRIFEWAPEPSDLGAG